MHAGAGRCHSREASAVAAEDELRHSSRKPWGLFTHGVPRLRHAVCRHAEAGVTKLCEREPPCLMHMDNELPEASPMFASKSSAVLEHAQCLDVLHVVEPSLLPLWSFSGEELLRCSAG